MSILTANFDATRSNGPARRASRHALAALLSTVALVSPAYAGAESILPDGASVVGGRATVAQSGNTVTVTQTSKRAVVNWQSFSVGEGASVDFVQPDARAAILNRVLGTATSEIAGSITANGQVFLVNPNGIILTRTGTVRADGGFVASTLDIDDQDFLKGKLAFHGTGSTGVVSNAGSILVGRQGFAALLGSRIEQNGTISVPLGKIGLGAADAATLDPTGDGFLQIALPSSAADDAPLLKVTGVLEGARVELRANTAANVTRETINVSGELIAKGASQQGGEIVLDGGEGATTVTGHLDASSQAGVGGSIALGGRSLALTGASLDANGTSGGEITIGGGLQGAERAGLTTADSLSVDALTSIRADGTSGNGGKIVLWSDRRTDFAGLINARALGTDGRGGFAEVSGKQKLDFTGRVDLTAVSGATGDLLLDPYNLTISTGTTSGVSSFVAGADDSVLNVDTLTAALASANVTVSTGGSGSGSQTGNITVATNIAWSANTTLRLNADGGIVLNSGTTITNSGATSSLQLAAAGTGGISGSGNIANSGALTLELTNASAASTYSGVISGAGSLTKTGSGAITLSGVNSYSGGTTINAGKLRLLNTTSTHATLGSAGVVVSAGALLEVTNNWTGGVNFAFNNAISGAGGVVFSGAATALTTLGTSNSYTGGTALQSGVISINQQGETNSVTSVFGTGTITMTGGGMRASNGLKTVPNAITVSGDVSFGSATNLSGTMTLAGNTTITPIVNFGDITWSGPIVLGSYTLSTVANPSVSWGNGLTISGVISGTGSIVHNVSGGRLTLSGANTYSGGTTINAGTLRLLNQTATAASLGTGGVVVNSGLLELTHKFSGAQLNFNNTISGAGGLLLTGTDGLTTQLGGANTFSGGTALQSGNINIDQANASTVTSVFGSGTITMTGGGIRATNGAKTVPNAMVLSGTNAFGAFTNFTGAISLAGNTTITPIADASGSIWSGGISLGSFSLTTALGSGNPTFGTGFTISGAITGTGGFTHNAANGSVTLSGANNYSGATQISAGTLIAGSSLALSSNSATTVDSGATLDLSGRSVTAGSLAGSGTITNSSATAAALTVGALNSSTTFSGAILNGTGGLSLTKTGTGTLTLSGASTYAGGTTISAGTLRAGSATAFGNGAISVTSGAALDLNGQTMTSTGTLTLNGTGISSGGALLNSSATAATYAGLLALGSNSSIIGGTGSIALTNSGTITGSGFNLILSGTSGGTLASIIGTGTGGLTKQGSGTWTLSGANTYSGGTLLWGGTLRAGSATAFGSGAISMMSGAALDLNGQTMTSTGTLTLNGTGISSGGALLNSSATAATYAGLIALGSNSSIIGGSGSIALTNSGTITGSGFNLTLGGTSGGTLASIIGTGTGTLAKQDSGTWTLSGASTYSGGTTISAGTLRAGSATAFGNGAISVTSGAALDLNGQTMTSTGTLTLNGTGISSGGALLNSSATAATYAGLLALGSSSSIIGGSGSIALTNSGTITGSGFNLTLGGTSGGTLASIIGTGTGTLAKQDSGTWTLSGDSTYSGGTTISAGTLRLLSTGSTGAALGSGEVAIASNALFEISNNSSVAVAVGNTISGQGGLVLSGADNQTTALSGANTFSGGTALRSGVINVDQGTGSAPDGGTITSVFGTGTITMTGGGIRAINGSKTITNAMVLNGALRFGSFTNFSGDMTLQGDTTITPVGTISESTWSGAVALGGFNLSTAAVDSMAWGNGTFTISGAISGTGGIAHNAGGRLALSGSNTYSGATIVSAGTLIAGSNSALGSNSATTVANGGTLDISGNSVSIGSLSGGGTITNSAGMIGVLTVGGLNSSTTFGGAILAGAGNIRLTKVGTGALTLSGASTYSGSTTISAGTLQLSGDINVGLADATVVVNSGATFAGTGRIISNGLQISGGGTVNLTGDNLVNTLSSSGTFPSFRFNNAKALALGSINTAGALKVSAAGDLTLNPGAQISSGASETAVILSSTGNFLNQAGPSAVSTANGRWLIFTAAPQTANFGGLNSANTGIWNSTYASSGGAISASGNRYVFAFAPVLTFTSVDQSKVYGTDATTALAGAYTISGYQSGIEGAFLGDTAGTAWSGAPEVTSAGAALYSTVAGGPYTINLAAGSLAGSNGYGIALASSGTLTVTPASLTVTGATTKLTYNGSQQTNSFTVSGLLGSDTVTGVSGLAQATHVSEGSVSDALSGATGSGIDNYTVSYVNGSLTIDPAVLTVTGSNRSATYTSSALVNSSATFSGLQGSDSFTVSGYGSGTAVGSYADNLALTAASGTQASDYTISLTGGKLTVTPASLTVTGATKRLTYNGNQQTNSFTVSGLLGGDTVTGVSGLAQATNVDQGTVSDALSEATGSGLSNYTVSYVNGSLTIDPAALTLVYTANAARSAYGASLADLSGTVTGTGFVGSEGVANLGGSLTWTTTATNLSPAGRYAITGSGLTSSNYTISATQAAGNSTAYTVAGDTNVSPTGTPVALTATYQSAPQVPETKPLTLSLGSSGDSTASSASAPGQGESGGQDSGDNSCSGGGGQDSGSQNCQ